MNVKKLRRVGVLMSSLVVSAGLFFAMNLTAKAANEAEDNDTFETANVINVNEDIHGTMDGQGLTHCEKDFYKFTITEPGSVSIDFTRDNRVEQGSWYYVTLFDSNQKEMWKEQFGGDKMSVSFLTLGVGLGNAYYGDGTYYVQVACHEPDGSTYNFKVNYTASANWEAESNGDKDKANVLVSGQEKNGVITSGGYDEDFYKMEVSEPGYLTLHLSNEYYDNPNQWYVTLLDANDQVWYKTTLRMKNTEEQTSDAIEVAPGTYYVRVSGTSTCGVRYTVRLDYYSPVEQVRAFVTRMYEVALGRTPDAEGLNDWTNRLMSGDAQAVNIVQGFMCSKEYTNKHKSNGEIVTDCYKAMLGRTPDQGGYNDWVSRLDNGMSVEAILAGFVGSQEFTNLCNSYGIQPGAYSVSQARDMNPGVTAFVARIYTKALGRNFDESGLNDWCGQIVANPSRENIMNIAMVGFFHSEEFLNKNLNNTEYVKVLYRTYLGREYDDAGLADWVGQLDRGEKDRDQVMAGFAYSAEFNGIMAQYGL